MSSTSLERIEGVAATQALLDELGDHAAGPFQTGAWLGAWAEAWEPGTPVFALAASRGGALVGALPLAWLGRALHPRLPIQVRYLGVAGSTGGADHVGAVAADPDVAAALVGGARRAAGRRPLLLEHAGPEFAAAVLQQAGGAARVVRSHPCPLLDLHPDPEPRWSSRQRKSIRRRARLLADAGWAARWVTEEPGLSDALGKLRLLHEDRWGDRALAGSFDERRDRLLRALTAGWRMEGGPAVQLIEHEDGRVGGAQLVLRHRRSWSVYKTGWDPNLAAFGPGVHLAVGAIRSARDAGVEHLDFLRGVSPYKYALGAVDRVDQSIALIDTVGGRLLAERERLSERRSGAPTRAPASAERN